MNPETVRCPHPNCNSRAEFVQVCGGTSWFRCILCRFEFPLTDERRGK